MIFFNPFALIRNSGLTYYWHETTGRKSKERNPLIKCDLRKLNICMAGMGKDKAERERENVGVPTENYRNDNTGLFHFT